MRVLMLGWELPPHNSGGLGIACQQLAKQLAYSGADIDFVVPFSGNYNEPHMQVHAAEAINPDQAYKSVYDGYHSPTVQRAINTYTKFITKLTEVKQFDVVHAHDWMTFLSALHTKKFTGLPIIMHVHSIERDRAGGGHGNPYIRDIEMSALRQADEVIGLSHKVKANIIEEYEVPSDKISVVHNAIDPSMFTHNATTQFTYIRAMKQRGYHVAVNVGRLTIQKGLPQLLRAFALVAQKQPKSLLVVAGSGEQHDELLELSAALGTVSNVIFTGFARGAMLEEIYSIGDVFVMPSISEPFGLTPLEAALRGTGSIVSKQSGVSEVFKHCLKVDYWDEQELANKILAIFNQPALNDYLSQNASIEANGMSWRSAAETLLERYRWHARGVRT